VNPVSSALPFRRSRHERSGIRQYTSLVAGPARRAAFWSAIVLPFALLGLIVIGSVAQQASLVAGLVGANLVALGLGHGHKRD